MNHVGKETAENFYGTGERDHQLMLRYDGVRGCDSEREVSWPERRTVPGGQNISCGISMLIYVTGSNSRMMVRRSPYISRRPDLVQVFSFSFGGVPDGQGVMYIGEGYEGSARE